MVINIDIDASIIQQSIVYHRKNSSIYILSETLLNVVHLIILIIPILVCFYFIKVEESLLLPITFLVLYIPFCVLSVSTFFASHKLKKIHGTHSSINRKISQKICEELYWDLHKKHSKIIIAEEYRSWNHWGRQFIILFHHEDVLFNCRTKGRYKDTWSPFHWYGNRINEKRFKRKFLEKLAKKSFSI